MEISYAYVGMLRIRMVFTHVGLSSAGSIDFLIYASVFGKVIYSIFMIKARISSTLAFWAYMSASKVL